MTAIYTGAPHPDYPDMVWSTPEVEGLVLPVIEAAEHPFDVVAEVTKVLDTVGYDSMDREMAFWIATQLKGWDYEVIYQAWIDPEPTPGHYRSRAARDAQSADYGTQSYWDSLDRRAIENAKRWPDRADHFLTRTLGEALAGNNGL